MICNNHLSPSYAPEIDYKVVTTPMNSTVLVVEDNPFNRELASSMLESLGLQVVLANNGQEAIDLVKENDFVLVLMDCQMPVVDGYEATIALRQLENDGKHLPIIALTANAMSEVQQKCLDAGMDDFLSKPFTYTQLEAMLKKWNANFD